MIDMYLITGFLGSGKTTFLKNFINCFPDKKIYIIVNEFGKVGIDGTLLQSTGAGIAEINNGSMFCSCRMDQFENALMNAIAVHPDILLIETSGLSDPSRINHIISTAEYSEIEYRGSICLIDAVNFLKVIETAQNCRKQLSISSVVLINKCDLVLFDQLLKVQNAVYEIQPSAKIYETEFGYFEEKWLQKVHPAGESAPTDNRPDITLQKAAIQIAPETSINEMKLILKFLKDFTFRIKGFVQLKEGVYFVDCTGMTISVTSAEQLPYTETGTLVALAGRGMPLRNGIIELKSRFPEEIDKYEL